MREPRDSIGKTILSVIDKSEVPDMGPKIWVRYEEAVEVHIVYPHWWASTEVDGVEYVFLGGKDEGPGGEGTGGECGLFESWL